MDVLSNYRPNSVIGHIAKMVEQLVLSQLVRYLEEHTFITPDQSASPKSHSTQTSLHRVIDDRLDNINEDQITGVCLLDISKCLDTINHSILLQKLSMYGKNTKIWNGFLPISIIGSKLCSVTMNFRVLLMLHVAYRRGLFLDHFYSYCSLVLYHNSQLMGVYQIYMQMTRWFIHQVINILEVQQKLQQCVKNISSWYKINRLKINIDKTKVTLIGSKAQLKYSNVDDFFLSYDDTPLELVENVKYLGIFKNCDISWDFHVRRLCQSTYYRISLPRRLRRIFPMNLLLQVYKSYIQPRLDYGITLYGCSTQKNIDLFQRVQNHAARLIMVNFDYINCLGIDLVRSLNLYTILEKRDYFLMTLMFKAIHRIAPHCLSNHIDMHFDINGYDTREAGSMNVYLSSAHKEIYSNSSLYSGGKLWNELPDLVKNSTNIETFKLNYRIYKSST